MLIKKLKGLSGIAQPLSKIESDQNKIVTADKLPALLKTNLQIKQIPTIKPILAIKTTIRKQTIGEITQPLSGILGNKTEQEVVLPQGACKTDSFIDRITTENEPPKPQNISELQRNQNKLFQGRKLSIATIPEEEPSRSIKDL